MNTLPPIPFNNPAKPILLESLMMREQCWAQLLDKYEPSLANLIIACNDALYRYDIFTEMPFAYDMELYDEYMNEAVALALKLSQSLTFLDKQKITVDFAHFLYSIFLLKQVLKYYCDYNVIKTK